MKRSFFLLVFLGAVSATLVFAGGTAESKTGAASKTTVTMIFDAVQQNHDAVYQEWAQKYMDQHPDVLVKVTYGPKEVTDLLGLYLQYFAAKRSDIDVYGIDVVWPGDLADQLVDLNQYGAKAVVDQYFPSMVQNGVVKGRLVAIPYLANAPVLYYRTDLLQKYGYTQPPKTWNDLADMAAKIQQGERAAGNQDFWGFVYQGKAYEGLTCDALEWISSFGGGTIVDPNGTITINNPNAVAALTFAAGTVGTIAPPGVTGFDEEASRAVWQAGNAAFMRNWPYAYTLGNGSDSVIKGKFDITTLPAGPGGQSAGTLGGLELAVSKYSKNPQKAADVAFFFAGKDFQKAFTINTSEPSPVESLYQDPDVLKAIPFFSKMQDVLMHAVPRPSSVTAPKYNDVSRLFFTAVHDVLTKQADASSALQNLSSQLKDLLNR
jgi:trehalose/maltose transport system substrate-binding protein